ncbi:unnamed protein product, partial [Aureobasidium mustum]
MVVFWLWMSMALPEDNLYFNVLIQQTTTAASESDADIIMEATTLQQAGVMETLAGIGGVPLKYKRVARAMIKALKEEDEEEEDIPDDESGNEEITSEDDEKPEDDSDEEMVLVREHERSLPQAALRASKDHYDAWHAAINAPIAQDNPFTRLSQQIIVCLRTEAAQGIAEVFNLIEHAGVARRFTNALRVLQDTESQAHQQYITWYCQRGRSSGPRGSYDSLINFILTKALNAVFSHQVGTVKTDNLRLVTSMVLRAEVLRALENAFGAGQAWTDDIEEILIALADRCPMLRRVYQVAETNVWSRIVQNRRLSETRLNVEVLLTDRECSHQDLLTLLSLEGEDVQEVEMS